METEKQLKNFIAFISMNNFANNERYQLVNPDHGHDKICHWLSNLSKIVLVNICETFYIIVCYILVSTFRNFCVSRIFHFCCYFESFFKGLIPFNLQTIIRTKNGWIDTVASSHKFCVDTKYIYTLSESWCYKRSNERCKP